MKANEDWAVVIVFALSFGESLAFVSLLLPATVLLIAASALIGASGLEFWPVWGAAAVGAILGDWVSYWIGYRYKNELSGMWPLSRSQGLMLQGEAFFRRWGAAGVFLGRFFGPLRCVMPLIAGIMAMPSVPFQIANVSSGVIWATGILAPGVFGVRWLTG
jgi:membrane protein DedA with SNARE-associated domain